MLPDTFKNIILCFSLIFAISAIQGQGQNQSEADVLARAEVLYAQNNWQEAMPLYAQLVSVNPEKPEYNYKFGVCTLLGDRSNRRRPIRYLGNAYKTMSASPEINYYLGLAYYQNEEFANAMKYLNIYLGKLDPTSPERAEILEKVNACLNGMNLEHNNHIAEIIEKSEFQKDNFHRAYRADDFEGMLIIKPENFISSQEKNSGNNSYVYISEPRGTLYFSSYENSKATQRDIYKVSLDENGDWGTPEKLPEVINTNFDEAYPVLTNNGSTLYFCSKGHNAVGGYDVFVSTIDIETKQFSTPENLGIGINSPFDDVLYIPEKSGDFAWFASNRDNLNNDITVYKIRLNNNLTDNDVNFAQNLSVESNNKTQSTQSAKEIQSNVNSNYQNQEVAQQQLAPSEKAAKKLAERTIVNQLADTAYIMVSNTKTYIRNLTNKRDRANLITEKKEEEAKALEVEFQDIVSNLANAADKDQFEQQLTKAIRLKKDIYQFRMRSDQANRIAWSIGKQIKIKNDELIELKKAAGDVQTLSVQGDLKGTQETFAVMAKNYTTADTLADYSQNILWLSKDEVMFNLPESELAFADNLRNGYDNHTLLAKAASQPIQENIPINVVDNRTSSVVLERAAVVKTLALVERVAMKGYNKNILPGEEYELEINFDIDAVPTLPIISPVVYLAKNNPLEMDAENLEINTNIDVIDAFKLVNSVSFDALAFEEFTMDETIEVSFTADVIDALPIVMPIFYEALAESGMTENEVLEISNLNNIAEVLPLIQAISFDDNTIANLTGDEFLEISNLNDIAEVLPLIQAISYDDNAIASLTADEFLEISNLNDITDVLPLIQTITYDYLAIANIPENEALEISIRTDGVTPFKLVAPIYSENLAFSEIADEASLEISLEKEIETLQLVRAINFDEVAVNTLPKEEELEINTETNNISTYSLIAPIEYTEIAFAEIANENLEIKFEQNQVSEYKLIQPIFATNINSDIAFDETLDINIEETKVSEIPLVQPIEKSFVDIAMNIEETLDISRQIDQISPLALIQPVLINDLTTNFVITEEPLDIHVENEESVVSSVVYDLVMPVSYTAIASNMPEITDELEISFSLDVAKVIPTIYPIELPAFANNDFNIDDELQISYYIDENTGFEVLTADNATIAQVDMNEISNNIPEQNNEYYYLRQTMGTAENIETSRTDFEMLRLALINSDELSYEELLFAASLTPKPEDKLKIYNVAFIHIDRDWRAFNNAAVIALNTKDLDKAECFLYQATLISDDNGKILNNLGILDCYKNDFASAENHFMAASEKGVNTDYNLQVVKSVDKPSGNESLKSEIGKTRYFDVIGDNGGYNADR